MLTYPITNKLIYIPSTQAISSNKINIYPVRDIESDIFIKSISNNIPSKISTRDINYKKTILETAGLSNIPLQSLNSVIGPDELNDLVKKHNENPDFYTPGYRPLDKLAIPDSYQLENIENKKFGGNFHIHTVHSDGKMTVYELLEQAVEYANIYSKTNNEPFTIGISDHNTINGCKEVIDLLIQNPEKYKNLRVILGVEVSTKEQSTSYYTFKKPEKFHVLVQCINPFDKKVQSFFEEINEGRTNPMHPKQISIKDVVDGFKTQKDTLFSLAHPAYPNLKRRVFETDNLYEVLKSNIQYFKDITKEKCFYVENYYQGYYDDLATDNKLHKTICEICDKLNILKSGGIDTHGFSIFYNGVKKS